MAKHVHRPRRVDPRAGLRGDVGLDEEDGVRRLPGAANSMSVRALREAARDLSTQERLVVQYAPHAFGLKAMNVPFCLWLLSMRSRAPWVMFHEVAFPFTRKQPARHRALATVTHVMASIVAAAADRIFVSIPAWTAT